MSTADARQAPTKIWLRVHALSLSLRKQARELRNNLVDISHDAEVGNVKDRSFFIVIDRNDVFGRLHTRYVMRRAGNS